MDNYMSTADARLVNIQARIDKKELGTHESFQSSVDTGKRTNIEKEVQPDEEKLVDLELPIEGDWKVLDEIKSMANDEEKLKGDCKFLDESEVFGVARKKLPIRSSRAIKASNKDAPIVVSSPTKFEGESMLELTFEISNSQVNVVEKGQGRLVATRGNVARSRLTCGADIEFVSMRTKLFLRVDECILRAIFVDEASTRTMNLFAMWMENKLPLEILEKVLLVDSMWYSMMPPNVVGKFLNRFFRQIDGSSIQLCFFPIICRNHWSLFTLFVNEHKKVYKLKGKNSYLLYMDSLGVTNPKECLDHLYIALRCMAPIVVADSTLQDALFNPEEALELKIVEVPQQPNAIDCGFYVMAFIRYLIAGIMQNGAGKTWLTK